MPWVVGIDPGNNGAAVLLGEDGGVVAVARWRVPVVDEGERRVLRATISTADGARVVNARTAYGLGRVVAALFARLLPGGARWVLGCEEAYVAMGRGVGSPGASLKVARFGGAVSGPFEDHASGDPVWMKAGVWRHGVFGLPPNTPRDAAKKITAARLQEYSGLHAALGLKVGRKPPQDVYDGLGVALGAAGITVREEGAGCPTPTTSSASSTRGGRGKRARNSSS